MSTEPPTPPPPKPERTDLDRALSDRATYLAVTRVLSAVARRRAPPGQADDAISKAFVRAIQQERAGNRWDPLKQTVEARLVNILYGVLKDARRLTVRKPTSPWREGDDAVSASLTADEHMIDEQDWSDREKLAQLVEERLAEQTRTGLTRRMLQATRDGIVGHDNLAAHLGCSVQDIRSAYKRIDYHSKVLVSRVRPS